MVSYYNCYVVDCDNDKVLILIVVEDGLVLVTDDVPAADDKAS